MTRKRINFKQLKKIDTIFHDCATKIITTFFFTKIVYSLTHIKIPISFVLRSIYRVSLKLLLVLTSIVLLASLSQAKDFVSNQRPVLIIAKINNQVISNKDLQDRINLVLKLSKIKFSEPNNKRIVIEQILQKMIDEKLIIKEAQDLSIVLDENKAQQLELIMLKSWGKDKKQFNRFFDLNSLSYGNFLDQLKAEVLWSQIVSDVIAPKIKISQSEVNEFLEVNKINPDAEKILLSEIFIPFNYRISGKILDEKDLIFKLSIQLGKGKGFEELVKKFSRGSTSEFGGEIGWIGDGDIEKEIYKQISYLKINEITQPIKMIDGYRIFKVNNKKYFNNLSEKDLNQTKNIIFKGKLDLLTKEYLSNLRKNSYIEINEKLVVE